MKLFEVIKNIKKICYTIPNVNQVIEGDVYDLNKLKDIKYSTMVITEQSHSTDIDNGYVTYGLNIFYVDRALSDGSNELDVHSHAIDALNVVISAIEDMGGIITNNYVTQTFKERFGDVCFGAFATINARFDIDECDGIKLVTSVNGKTGDVIINTEGVSVEELNQRLKNYNTKEEDNSKFQPKGNYATKSELNDYALKSEIPTVPTKLSDLQNDTNFISKSTADSTYQEKGDYALKSETPSYLDIPKKLSELENDSDFVTSGQVYSKEEVEAQFALKSETPSYLDIPTKLSQLENDSDFLVSGQTYDKEEIDAQFAKKSELPTVPTKLSELENNVGFVTYDTVDRDFQQKGNYAYKNELPTKTSELTNDSGFLTEHQELKTINGESIVGQGNIEIKGGGIVPTKLSELQNDMGFITSDDVPEIPENVSAFNNDAGYLTEHQSLEDYAKKSDIPTTTSELDNDSGFITIDDIPEPEKEILYYEYSPTLSGREILGLVNSGKKVILRDRMGGYGDYFNFEFFAYSQMRRAGAPAVDYMTFMCLDGRSIVWSGEGGSEGSWETNYDENVHKSELPKKTSQLTNDSGFITQDSVPTKLSELENDSHFITLNDVPSVDVPTKLSELENDTNFISKSTADSTYQEKGDYALKSELPTVPENVSAFNNDAGYITEHQSLDDYAKKSELPTKTSELTNDSGFLTEHQELKTINGESIVGSGNIEIEGGESNLVIFNLEDVAISDMNLAIEEGKEILIKESAGFGYYIYSLIWGEPDYYVFSRFFENELVHGGGQKLLYFPSTDPESLKNYDVEWVDIPFTTSQLTNDSGFLTNATFEFNSTTKTLNIKI